MLLFQLVTIVYVTTTAGDGLPPPQPQLVHWRPPAIPPYVQTVTTDRRAPLPPYHLLPPPAVILPQPQIFL